MVKVAAGQFNPTVGDFSGNAEKMVSYCERAKAAGADLILFPELSLVGYPPRDLLDYGTFLDACESELKALVGKIKGITAVIGTVTRNKKKTGRPLFNSAVVVKDGKVLATYHKRLLPYYDVFDENRYFESGDKACTFKLKGKKIGVFICEDAWNIPGYLTRGYDINPMKDLKGCDLVLNLSASPYRFRRATDRCKMFSAVAKALKAPLLICNQVGANDELIFDGSSFFVHPSGKILARAKAFEEDLLLENSSAEWPKGMEELRKALVLGLKDYLKKTGQTKIILGLSGGVDSSLAVVLAVEAVGKENVLGVALPSRFNLKESETDAAILAKHLGISYQVIEIEEGFEWFAGALEKTTKGKLQTLTLENLQPRIRMTLLMALANEQHRVLLNTSNKSEIATGYATLYGDSAGGIAILGDLTKNEVYELCRYLNTQGAGIPERVLTRAPTAELRENQKDEDSLPPYSVLDPMVEALVEESRTQSEMKEFPEKWTALFGKLHAISEYKRRQLPPVLRVSPRAFGMGRRIPIASHKPWSW